MRLRRRLARETRLLAVLQVQLLHQAERVLELEQRANPLTPVSLPPLEPEPPPPAPQLPEPEPEPEPETLPPPTPQELIPQPVREELAQRLGLTRPQT
jgi:hypothetical protein